MDEQFGKFVRTKREEKGMNLRKLAELLEIAPAYMSDMEKARRYPPDKEKLYKIAEILDFTKEETNTMFDLAALAKDNTVSPDLPEYIMDHEPVRVALRKARDLDMDDEEWMKVIEVLERKEQEMKKREIL